MRLWLLASCLIAGIICESPAAGLQVQLDKITEVSSPVMLGDPVVVSGAAFYYGLAGGASPGLYRNGSLVVAAGGMISSNEVGVISPVGSDGTTALLAGLSNHAAPTANDFYNTLNTVPAAGAPTRILSRGTILAGYPAPPHPGNPIGGGTISGSQVAFLIREAATASPRQPSALALCPSGGGTVSVIVKEGDAVPNGGGTFSVFDNSTLPYIHNGSVIFTGRSNTLRRGIYEWAAGNLSVVVDGTMARPEGGTFSSSTFGLEPVKDGLEYAFLGGTSLYRKRNGALSLVANSSTPVPGGTGNFSAYTTPTLRNGWLVFNASRGTSEYGIYLDLSGTITPIVDKRTDFGAGKIPATLSIAKSGAWVADNTIVFRVTFSDNSTAIYKATFQDLAATLAAQVVFTGPRTGTITVTSKTGYSYKLLRTTTLAGNDEEGTLRAGTGGSLTFSFDDSARSDVKAFFRVRETKD